MNDLLIEWNSRNMYSRQKEVFYSKYFWCSSHVFPAVVGRNRPPEILPPSQASFGGVFYKMKTLVEFVETGKC